MDSLDSFFSKLIRCIGDDERLSSYHVALLMALLYYQNSDRPMDFFYTSRKKLMHFSRIGNIVSYHKFLTQLVKYGYIEYVPSWHPVNGSRFRFIIVTDSKNS